MIFNETVKIGLKDIEKDNILGNKAILKFFENIAGHHSDSLGYGLNNSNETHLSWILLEWKIRSIKRIEYGEELSIDTWSRSIEKYYASREFKMYNSKGELCVIGTSKWLLINTEKGSIVKPDETMIAKYESEPDNSVFEEDLEKIKAPEEYTNELLYTVRRKDIDFIGHMHNLYYLDLAYEVLPDDVYEKRLFNDVRITYKKEIKLGETVKCKYANVENKHVVVITSEDDKTVHALIELK